jgi:hypothetical protein
MIAAVAVCPHPPLLVPTIAGGAAFETDGLRAACDDAVGRLLATAPEQLLVIGADGGPGGSSGPAGAGSLRDFAPGAVGLPESPFAGLALSLAIGWWLLDRAAAHQPRQLVGVRPDGTPTTSWPELSPKTGLLVMADGSARRSIKGPGYLDERAEPFDAAVTKALSEADVDALANLDSDLCAQLLVGGVGAWKALAVLATRDTRWRAEVLYDAAPYGVQYTVATWLAG